MSWQVDVELGEPEGSGNSAWGTTIPVLVAGIPIFHLACVEQGGRWKLVPAAFDLFSMGIEPRVCFALKDEALRRCRAAQADRLLEAAAHLTSQAAELTYGL